MQMQTVSVTQQSNYCIMNDINFFIYLFWALCCKFQICLFTPALISSHVVWIEKSISTRVVAAVILFFFSSTHAVASLFACFTFTSHSRQLLRLLPAMDIRLYAAAAVVRGWQMPDSVAAVGTHPFESAWLTRSCSHIAASRWHYQAIRASLMRDIDGVDVDADGGRSCSWWLLVRARDPLPSRFSSHFLDWKSKMLAFLLMTRKGTMQSQFIHVCTKQSCVKSKLTRDQSLLGGIALIQVCVLLVPSRVQVVVTHRCRCWLVN